MFRTLAGSIREYKAPSLRAPLFVSCETVMECLIPYTAAGLVNSLMTGATPLSLAKYGAVMCAIAFMSLLCGWLAGRECSTASCGFAHNLRADMFRAVQRFSSAELAGISPSSLITRLTTDIENVQDAYMMLIRTVIRGPLMVVFSCTMAFVTGGRSALVFVYVLPFLCAGLWGIAYYAVPLFRRLFTKYDRLNSSIQENVSGIRAVKAFVRSESEKEKFTREAGALCREFTSAERIVALNNPLMQLSMYTATLFILYYGTYRVITTRGLAINAGQISALLVYGVQMLGSLMRMSMVFVGVLMARESAVRIAEVLRAEPSITSPANGIDSVTAGTIEFDGVSFTYPDGTRALEGVSFRVNAGETVGITGPAGCGKSTIVQLLLRLYDPSSGTVRVSGQDLRAYDLRALRENVGVVFQQSVLFSGTVRENLKWGNPDATDSELLAACRSACIDSLSLDTLIEQGGVNLSGGQKQRLCIARALLKMPKILVLDDSLSAVDMHTEGVIRARLKEYDCAKVIISQRIKTVKGADKILVLDNGRIEAAGTHDELLTKSGIYREMYSSQQEGDISR